MYDKFGRILRIETTTVDVTFFRHYREVEQRHGTTVMKYAPMKKTIYSLGALREVLAAANRRYLEFLSAIDDPSDGIRKLNKISETSSRRRPLLPRVQLLRPRRRPFVSDHRARRIQHQRVPKQATASVPVRTQQRSSLTPAETLANPRANQEGESLLQILPDPSRPSGDCAWSEIEESRHRARTRPSSRSLRYPAKISKNPTT